MIENNKRNNYYDGQFVDIDDFKTEQNYFLDKIREITDKSCKNGTMTTSGLKVETDTIMAEPVSSSDVAVAIEKSLDVTAPNPQNYTVIPNFMDPTAENFQIYTTFITNTHNIQTIDLRITLGQQLNSENLDLIIRLRQLVDGTNPLSPLANVPPLVEIQLSQADLPPLDSDNMLEIDVSNENSGQGVSVVQGIYYAIELIYRRPINSISTLRMFHSPLNQLDQYDPNLFSFVFSNGKYTQTFSDYNGLEQKFVLYYKASTSAVKISSGEATINGNKTVVEADQFRFLEIPDRRNLNVDQTPVWNYLILQYAEQYTDSELIQSTRNSVNTRIKDSSTAQVLSEPQWQQLLSTSDANSFLLLATISDTNIVSIFEKNQFSVPANSTNFTFHDWLNPSNTTPTDEATQLQLARPTDFIFFITNVPGQVPLTDVYGNVKLEPATVLDEFGNVIKRAGDPIIDEIVRVVANLSLDNGKNTRSLELALVSEVGSTTTFRSYAATISNLFDNPFDNVFTFNFNTDQLAPNVTYNFVAYTTRGMPIYIQDYNKSIIDSSGKSLTSLREQEYQVFLNQNVLSAVIEKDLQLGAFNPVTDQSQPGIVQYVQTFINNQQFIPIGNGQEQIVTLNDGYLLSPDSSFTFKSPMITEDGYTKIVNTDQAVQTSYDIGDINVFVDLEDGNGPVDITFSGTSNRDKGGNGVAVLVKGSLDVGVVSSSTTLEVKVRNANGKDNTNTSSLYNPVGPGLVGGPDNIREFNVIARSYNPSITPTNLAGFNDGDQVFIFIDDQQALDQNYQPISFIFQSSLSATTVVLPTIKHLGPKKYFREKLIKSVQSSGTPTPGTILIDTGLDANQNSRTEGRIIFNRNEIPTAIEPNSKVSIIYNSAEIVPQSIDYLKTNFAPVGTKDGFKIENINIVSSSDQYISVPEAFALTNNITNISLVDPAVFQSAVIFVDGINITSILSPIGKKEIVADDGVTLQPGQVAFNPDQGTLKFYKTTDGYSNIISEMPDPFTRVTITYFKLETKFIFNTTTTATYEPKFDLNGDGRIDELDLSILNRSMGSQAGDLNYIVAADFNNDGKVDSADMTLFEEHFGAVVSGEPDYSDATSARLNAILVAKQDDFLKSIKVIKAVSKRADASAPNGRTVLFFNTTTPVRDPGNYVVKFGFAAAMSLGYIQTEVETERPLTGVLNLENISMFESINPTNTKSIIQIEGSTLINSNNKYNSVITFSPAINQTSEFTIKSAWSPSGIAIVDKKDLIIPQKYEKLDRQVYGPFKLQYDISDFKIDGTSIKCTLKVTDATFADGSPDLTGTHIQGVPLSELTFTIHLTIKNPDNTSSIWTWNQIQPTGIDNKIVLDFNDKLFIDHKYQGKNYVEVLTPFGLGSDQIALKPKFAGGDLENDLSNVSVIRSDVVSKYVGVHTHLSDRDGGVLNSRSVLFADDLARLDIPNGDVTDAVYRLLDIIADQQRQIELLRAVEGALHWDSGEKWDTFGLTWT